MRRMLAAVFLAVLLTGCAGAPAPRPEPLALRALMQELGRDSGAIAEALAREDWLLVERAAGRIAAHPQPPAEERAKIIAFLGARAGKFRGYDQEAGQHAQALAAAARRADGRAALEAFYRMQSACMGCHAEFRPALLRQFYPPPLAR